MGDKEASVDVVRCGLDVGCAESRKDEARRLRLART